MINIIKNVLLVILFCFKATIASSETIKKIDIIGNERIPAETVTMFSSVSINDDLSPDSLNKVLKNIYDSNFFKNVSIKFDNNILIIDVQENPIIENVEFSGIKAKRIREALQKNIIFLVF